MHRSTVVAVLALVAVACSGGRIGAPAPTPTVVVTGGVALPQDAPLPDTSVAAVDLADIHFDTFDGGSVPLSRADAALIRRLRDAIPPIAAPVYVDAAAAVAFLDPDDLVIGYVAADGRPYAYPTRILDFHEIVDDVLGDVPVVVTYCPLCRSGAVYDRRVDGRTLTFGNTSALYNADLVMYDHQTGSYWWQVAGRAIVGPMTGAELELLPSTTTTFGLWRESHPDTLVLSPDTGFLRPYGRDTFAGYRERVSAGRVPFPVATEALADTRLDPAEEVAVVAVGGVVRAYPLRTLGDAAVDDEVGGRPVVVFVRGAGPSARVFDPVVEGQRLTFRWDGRGFVDEQTGSRWDDAGRATAGPLAGTELAELPARHAFWFAVRAAFPAVEPYLP